MMAKKKQKLRGNKVNKFEFIFKVGIKRIPLCLIENLVYKY